ncbi:unnamed protein product [Macrosiphum euphorbiae]|uniref:Nose resistant-to-fluoxetine protein N-terminal domain-containing protein n=1 Tax=Macrosiphum euphorbiae TaxID=13131 RepID=A0AAV0XXE3_9HEMI|nr:unnamed protein product [Macrosiphum euphorbiae]
MSRPLLTIALFASVLQSLLLQTADGAGADIGDHILQQDAATDQIPGLWLSDLFYRALANFTLGRAESTVCRRQSALYEKHLSNHTSWAVRMLESWDRYPVGLLSGNTFQMGVYDECVDIRYPLKGQYCLSEIKVLPNAGRDYSFNRTEDLDDFGNNHAWKTILGWADYQDQVPRNIFHLGICIPDGCSALDLQPSLQREFDKAFSPEQFKTVVKVDPIKCRVREDMYPYDTPYYVTWCIFFLLVLICCCATLHHLIRILYQQNTIENGEVPSTFLYEFSFIESIKTLLKFNKHDKINFFSTLKVMVMVCVLYGHTLFSLFSNPISNPKFMENIYLNGPAIIVTSMNVVDPFFSISGYIMYNNLSRDFRKKKDESVFKALSIPIIERIIRLLPAYCAMMAITAHIVPHIGDGPLWPLKSWEEAEICKNYWWTNLLFISNFVEVNHQCLLMSWYLSCDVQFFIIGVIVVYVYTKNTKYGIALLGTIIGLSISLPFIITLWTRRDGIDKFPLPSLLFMRNVFLLNDSYRPSYMRATPFFGGLAMSFVMERLKEKKVKFSQTVVHSGTLAMFTFFFWVHLYGFVFYERNRPYYPLEHALHSTISHCTFLVLGMWLTMSYFTSGYGLLENLFHSRFVAIMGKLSYPIMLVNVTVMVTSQSSQRLPVHMSSRYAFEAYLYDLFMCYMAAIVLYLIVYEPFAKLTKNLLKGKVLSRQSKMEHRSKKQLPEAVKLLKKT